MPNAIVPKTGNQDIDGILWGNEWTDATLTYYFPTSATDYTNFGYNSVNGFQTFNTAQQNAVHAIMAMYAGAINLNFVFNNTMFNSIRFAEADSVNFGQGNFNIGTALGIAPDPGDWNTVAHGDTFYNATDFDNPVKGTYAYFNTMHEVGHALGLKHGHATQFDNQTGQTYPKLPSSHNSSEFSIMTYATYIGADTTDGTLWAGDGSFAQTLMQNDIRALQHMYGADFTTNNGNTVYKWSPSTGETFVNGASQGRPFENKILMTVWDGGGTDTYDLSNYSNAVTIDLRPGSFSKTGTGQLANLGFYANDGTHLARGNIANALLFNGDLRSLIEYAKGGSGSDTIYGNQAKNTVYANGGNDFVRGFDNNDILYGGAGNDSIDGGLGVDTLTGNVGRDVFVYRALQDSRLTTPTSDLIRDFAHSNGDRLHLSNIDAVAGSGNQAFEFIGRSGFNHAGQVRYTWANNDTYVWINTDSDRTAEMMIRLDGTKTLVVSDFVL
ncbi:MAG: M10 family metallopeptidase [Xanthobacteraceae bacterium]